VLEAGHPVPDAAGIAATRQVMELASTATAKDQVLVLLSGGGSANWIAPAGALTLAEKQGITRALLKSGATISEINTVRKHLSAIKGGRLVRLASPAPVLTLAISDVPHDDPSIIASGPTVPDPSTLADARAIVEKYRIELPGSARALLNDPANETPKPGDPVFSKSEFRLVARPAQSVEAAAEIARHAGYKVQNLGADLEGEARHVAALHANLARDAAKSGQRLVLLSGGELTVTVKGQGRGGPNQEYALALALELGGHPGIIALAGDTDGTDGGGGNADDPAGALIDETTLERAAALGLNPEAFLANNDATGFFEHLGDLLTPGPTGTNVNDLRAIIIG
jgi:hydroxypyruvate reductase